ncbi:ABC transporter G family member 20 [Folsomia candida]|uniref:ABC transporter G family member 20 n=1 Tax=Folsomia candida TaxID=158441 RepID=A0A226F393_FOLCA|nr:ABC transporter G family member 20 [Folsomia candida]
MDTQPGNAGNSNEAFIMDEKATDLNLSTEKPNIMLSEAITDPGMDLGNDSHGRNSTVLAVEVREAYKEYPGKKGPSVVLNGLNMKVKKGSIYSLLGSSGCGKTTLLSCCVGVRNLNKGEIRIFGHKPGSRDAGVPGPNVGFMPQEIALYPELTISEILLYFGRLYGMSKKEVKESMEFLVGFLALPPPHRRVGSLSGGQMRRVSFSLALIHSPRLLILDEPVSKLFICNTSDTCLIKTIAELNVLAMRNYRWSGSPTTAKVGLMRHGRLLAEDSPENLIKLHSPRIGLLEDVVLKLCLADGDDNEVGHSSSAPTSSHASSLEDVPNAMISPQNIKNCKNGKQEQNNVKNTTMNPTIKVQNCSLNCEDNSSKTYFPSTLIDEEVLSVELKKVICLKGSVENENKWDKNGEGNGPSFDKNLLCLENNNSPSVEELRKQFIQQNQNSAGYAKIGDSVSDRFKHSANRIQAMIMKNVVTLLRNIPFLLFMFIMPALQVIIVCIAIGPDPKGLSFGLVNHDARNACTVVPGCVVNDNYTGSLSCRFLHILDQKGTLKLKTYDNEEDAIRDVGDAKTWGYLLFHDNYTQSMKDRALFGTQTEPESIYGSRIKFRLDQSNLQIFRETGKVFLESFKEYMKSVSEDCGIDPIATEPPIYFGQSIFGEDNVNFTDFLAPSILLAILFFFPLSGSGIAYISEKKIGTLSRSMVAGVTTFEIMSAYLVVQVVLLCIQVALSLVILEWAFQVKVMGPVHCAYILAVMVGVAGMSMGFLLAVFLNNELEAVLVALGTFLPNMLLSGLLWPLEGMPIYLQYLSRILPCTFAGEALRSVFTRGVGYSHPSVYPGFISVSIWIVIYWTLNIVVQKYKAKK